MCLRCRFMEEIQSYYSESEEALMGWEEDHHCVAQMTRWFRGADGESCDDDTLFGGTDGVSSNRWYRTKILSRPDEHSAEVQSRDYGYKVGYASYM